MPRRPTRARRPKQAVDRETAQAIFEAAALLVVVLDPEARIVRFNAACEDATGYRAAELLGQPVWRLIPPEQHDEVGRVFRELLETGRASRHENDWLTKDGGQCQIAWSNTVVRDENGKIIEVIGTGLDVSELRASEEALDRSESRLAGIVHSAMDAIVTVNERQEVVLFNPAAEQMFGHASADVMGSPLDVLLPARFRDAHREHVGRFAASGETSRRMGQLGQVWGIRASGEEFPVEASISQTHVGDEVLLTVVLRDLTERQRLERQLLQAQELASVATLVTGIAHDIGTPMNVILGYTDLLGRALKDDKSRERLRIIEQQVERVTRLVQTLMNFARPQRERPQTLRVEDFADRALALIAETARKRRIAIERAYDETGPILGAGERLERALLDLFVNACDAIPQGGILRVVVRPDGDGVEVRVEDTGTGIAPELLERIFEPFYTTKPRGQGTGLGLLVTRGIVLEHGGSIDVESEVGVGTAFRIRLPKDGAAAPEDAGTPA